MNFNDRIVLAAQVGNLARLREFVENACTRVGLRRSDRFGLTLAVDEACSNIVEHGYRGRSDGTIELSIECAVDEVKVTIADRGTPFLPEAAPTPDITTGWEDRRPGGLGWYLIRQTVDEVRYVSDTGGNRLTLVKRRSVGSDAEQPGGARDGDDG